VGRLRDRVVAAVLLRDRLRALEEKKRLYAAAPEPGEIVARQVESFNRVWERCHTAIPFYREWRARHGLPARISSVKDLERFPVLTKRVIQEHQRIIFRDGRIRQQRSTGGSTGEPTRFPFSPRELVPNYADIYVGRSWYGVRPLDRMLLFWGHSHVFGTGLKGVLASHRRRLYDALFNIRRLNAYDVTPATIERYAEVYRREPRVRVVVGYTSCLYQLAKHLREHGGDGRKDGLKAVVVTAETVTEADVELLGEAFGVPVAIEYGMAETGVIAYSRGTPRNIQILWDSFAVTADPGGVLRVTTLYDKLFPLINYDTGDAAEVGEEAEGSVLRLSSVLGRSRDVLRLGTVGGGSVHVSGILLVHVLKSYPHIFSIECEQSGPGQVRILVAADRPLDPAHVKAHFLREIRKDHPDLDGRSVELRQVDAIPKTAAGKERTVRPGP
jgi:phenylacetate-coenzyme A ligase PaaK-like adenylate-forming protein